MTAAARLKQQVRQDLNAPPRAVRHRLPEERASITHKFSIAGHEGYITVGLYPTGQPGEIFIKMAKEGSTVSGLMDAFATSISLALAARRSAPRALREVCAHSVRAFRLDGQRADRLREEPDGLHLPLAATCASSRASSSRCLRVSLRRPHRCLSRRRSSPSQELEDDPDTISFRVWQKRVARRSYSGMGSTSAPGGSIRTGDEPRRSFLHRAAHQLCRTVVSSTHPTPCAACTRWAMRQAAPPAAPSWSATEAATAA